MICSITLGKTGRREIGLHVFIVDIRLYVVCSAVCSSISLKRMHNCDFPSGSVQGSFDLRVILFARFVPIFA